MHTHTGDYKEAIEYFQGVLNSHPANYPATVGLARAYRSHGNNKKAVETFKKYVITQHTITPFIRLIID